MSIARWRYGAKLVLNGWGVLLAIFALSYFRPEEHQTSLASWSAPNEATLPRGVSDVVLHGVGQFFVWLPQLLRGQWGESRYSNSAVFPVVLQATGGTLVLFVWTALVCSVVVMLLQGGRRWRQRSPADSPRRSWASEAVVLPSFLLAILLHELSIWHFGWIYFTNWPLFDPGDYLQPQIMLWPASVLALVPLTLVYPALPAYSAHTTPQRHTPGSYWQLCRGTLRPVLGYCVFEAVFIEYIFDMPGLGHLGFEAFKRKDVPMLQGFILGVGGLYLFLRVLCDPYRADSASIPEMPNPSPGNPSHRHSTVHRGVLGLICLVVLAVWAPSLSPYSPTTIHPQEHLLLPSSRYFLGTDLLGRDVLSRTLAGFRHAIPHVLGIACVALGIRVLLHYLKRLVPAPCADLWRGLRHLGANLPAFILAFIAFLVFEKYAWGPEIALTLGSIPLAYQATWRYSGWRQHLGSLLQVGEFVLLLDVTFGYLNVGTVPGMPTWGEDLRVGQHFSDLNPWGCLAPACAIVVSRYVLVQLRTAVRVRNQGSAASDSAVQRLSEGTSHAFRNH